MEPDAFDRTVCISKRKFTYDAVYDADVSNEELYGSVAPPLLDAFLNGYNATVRRNIVYNAVLFRFAKRGPSEPSTAINSRSTFII